MALTRSRKVTPGCISPLKRTNTDSGISRGMTPVAAAKATSPEPAGKLSPMGKRVCESPPVPTVSGKSIRFNQEWIMPSPGRKDTRSEEHTSELQSRGHLVCRLLLEKKKINTSLFKERRN